MFDEYVIGYTDRRTMFDAARLQHPKNRRSLFPTANTVFDSLILIGNQVVGSWRRTFKKGVAVIEVAPFARLTEAEHQAIAAVAQRYSAFLNMPVVLI